MKTSLNVKSLYRSILACSFGLALGLVDRLANAQDAELDAPATEVEYVEEQAEDVQATEVGDVGGYQKITSQRRKCMRRSQLKNTSGCRLSVRRTVN